MQVFFSFLLGKYLEMGLIAHSKCVFNFMTAKLFSKVVEAF